jgi:hypothetical protein
MPIRAHYHKIENAAVMGIIGPYYYRDVDFSSAATFFEHLLKFAGMPEPERSNG